MVVWSLMFDEVLVVSMVCDVMCLLLYWGWLYWGWLVVGGCFYI